LSDGSENSSNQHRILICCYIREMYSLCEGILLQNVNKAHVKHATFSLARDLTARTAKPLIAPPGFRMELGSKQSCTLCMKSRLYGNSYKHGAGADLCCCVLHILTCESIAQVATPNRRLVSNVDRLFLHNRDVVFMAKSRQKFFLIVTVGSFS
jgi:hypothetical protein